MIRGSQRIRVASAALLVAAALFDSCLCEEFSCPHGRASAAEIAEPTPDGCCPSETPPLEHPLQICCAPLPLDAVAPPATPKAPDEATAFTTALLAPVTTPEAPAPEWRRVRDAPLMLPAVPSASHQRLTRGPPPSPQCL
jgi:hypothetical protein